MSPVTMIIHHHQKAVATCWAYGPWLYRPSCKTYWRWQRRQDAVLSQGEPRDAAVAYISISQRQCAVSLPLHDFQMCIGLHQQPFKC